MSDLLTFTNNQQWATDNGGVVVSAGATTLSFLVVAWYTTAETDNENAAWIKTIPNAWKGSTIGAMDTSASITIPITKPTRDGVVLQVDHYAVYYQAAATYTLASASDKVASLTTTTETATTISLTATAVADGGDGTFAAAATNVATTDGLLINMKGQPRANISRAADGTVNRKSFAKDVTFDIIDLLFTVTTVSQGDWQQLLFWMKYGVPLKLTDSSTDKYITDYYGSIMAVDDPGTEGKNTAFDFPLQFMVEYETES